MASAIAVWFAFLCLWLFLYSGLYIMQRRMAISMGYISLLIGLAAGIFHAVTSDPIKKDERRRGCLHFHVRTTALHAIKTALSAGSLIVRALLVVSLFPTFNENPGTLVGISFGLDQWAIALLVMLLVDTGLYIWQAFVVDFTHLDSMSSGALYAGKDTLAGQEVNDQETYTEGGTAVEMSEATEGRASRKTPQTSRRKGQGQGYQPLNTK